MGFGSLDLEQDPALLSATELLDLYRARALSPVEATRACLHRIARLNPRLNAFRMVDEEGAMLAAHASEERWSRSEPIGLLDGIPATVKDLLLTKGWATLRGSRTIDPNQRWEEDAPSVARLREAGAVLLGKTTTPEFGWKGVTDSPLTGITRNPWNPAMTPGGSSGGAAVAAACGMGALHLGTDGGGSIRIPAGFTGIFGFKQSFGRVPAYPPSPFGTLAHVGPMTRTVADAALMLTVISRHDARDWYALPDAWTRLSRRIGERRASPAHRLQPHPGRPSGGPRGGRPGGSGRKRVPGNRRRGGGSRSPHGPWQASRVHAPLVCRVPPTRSQPTAPRNGR